MPETCGCKISAGYQIVGTENPRHVPPHIYEFCPLHARAAEMREILDDLVDAIEHEMEVSDTAVLPNVITQLAQARALLEETR